MKKARYGHAAASDGEHIFVFGGSGVQGFSGDIEIIKSDTQRTTLLANKFIPRRYFGAVWDGNESIYLIGGVSVKEGRVYIQTIVEVFNTRTYEVSRAPMLVRATRANSAVFIDGKIYVFGGGILSTHHGDGIEYVPWINVYDPKTRSWNALPDMPIEARSTKTAVLNNEIFLVGGYDGNQQFNDFHKFNPATLDWVNLPDLPYETSAHSIVTLNNTLYSFGDYNNLDQNLIFDFGSEQWQPANLPFQPSRHSVSAILKDTIYVIGGNIASRGSYLNLVQKFQH